MGFEGRALELRMELGGAEPWVAGQLDHFDEIVIAFDLDHGNGWGVYLRFEVPRNERKPARRARFPRQFGV